MEKDVSHLISERRTLTYEYREAEIKISFGGDGFYYKVRMDKNDFYCKYGPFGFKSVALVRAQKLIDLLLDCSYFGS